ncbi:MAG: DUF533 domain-containing protein [Fretibacterium sp.]|nr:DUF533 domain-containing protein [Fretibacterium sp.]
MAINFLDLLGSVAQGGMTGSSSGRMQSAASSLGSLTSLLGGAVSSSGGAGGLQSLLDGLMGGGQSVLNRAGQAAGGKDNLAAAGIGALLGALTGKQGSSTAMNGLGGGMMGLLGMMAYKALMGSGQEAASSGIASGAVSAPRVTEQQIASDAEIILTAMIDAAKADGQVDAEELNRITGRLKSTGAGQEGLNYVVAQLQAPMATEKIVSATRGRPELAAQVYSASLMAIEVDTQAERAYLDRLGKAMGLSASVIRNIEQLVGMKEKSI